jgi:hypothetical protein
MYLPKRVFTLHNIHILDEFIVIPNMVIAGLALGGANSSMELGLRKVWAS